MSGIHKAQPLHWEKILEPPYLGLCEGIAGVSKAALEVGQACLLRERPEASSPTPVHPPPAAPAPGGRPAFAVLKDEQHRSFASSPAGSRAAAGSALCVLRRDLVWKHSPFGTVLSVDSGSQGLAEAPGAS